MLNENDSLIAALTRMQYELDSHNIFHCESGKKPIQLDSEAGYVIQNLNGEEKAHFGLVLTLQDDKNVGGFHMIISGFDVDIARNRSTSMFDPMPLYNTNVDVVKMGAPTFPLDVNKRTCKLSNLRTKSISKYSRGAYKNGLTLGLVFNPLSDEANLMGFEGPQDMEYVYQAFPENPFAR